MFFFIYSVQSVVKRLTGNLVDWIILCLCLRKIILVDWLISLVSVCKSSHPRFVGENLEKNKNIYNRMETLAKKHQCFTAQLALAWVLHQGDDVVPIPGESSLHICSLQHIKQNLLWCICNSLYSLFASKWVCTCVCDGWW